VGSFHVELDCRTWARECGRAIEKLIRQKLRIEYGVIAMG
jgi:hypothetical protein